MKAKLLPLLALLVLCGCDAVVKEVPVGPTAIVQKKHSCQHFSYCFTCNAGLDGVNNNNCSMKMSHFCPGNQLGEYNVTPYRITHESGATELIDKEQLVRELGECE